MSDLMGKAEMNELPTNKCKETLRKVSNVQSSLIDDIGVGFLCASNQNGSNTCEGTF